MGAHEVNISTMTSIVLVSVTRDCRSWVPLGHSHRTRHTTRWGCGDTCGYHWKMALTGALHRIYQHYPERQHWTLLKFDICPLFHTNGLPHEYHSRLMMSISEKEDSIFVTVNCETEKGDFADKPRLWPTWIKSDWYTALFRVWWDKEGEICNDHVMTVVD